MDASIVRRVAAAFSGTVLLIGPYEDPDRELYSIPSVVIRPAVGFEDLPAIAAGADVLIMPYTDVPVTRAMQPLKLKEYLATGKPAVVRSLPATREWADACDVAESAEEFANLVVQRINSGVPESQKIARMRLEAESWEAKAELFEKWVCGT